MFRNLLILSLMTAPAMIVAPAITKADYKPTTTLQQEQDKLFFFTGNARVVSDITKKETWWPIAGSVRAGSRSEALELARAAARSQASIAGRVVDVDVHITN